jgi:arylsulfatase A-like enzyme
VLSPIGDREAAMIPRVLKFAVGLLGLSLLSCAPNDPPRPHIFVYLIDTLRADHVGCYGYARPTTPVIDGFADDAFQFANAYSASPWTRPSVASLFTGVPPVIHGVRGRAGWAESSLTTWAERLKERGYSTVAHFTNGNLEQRYGLGQGFDEYVFEEKPGKVYLPSPELHERWLKAVDEAVTGLETPLFHYVHSMDPHVPFTPQREFRQPFVRDEVRWKDWFDGDAKAGESIRIDYNRYNAEIRQNDHAFGLFLDALRARGWYEDSWIVLVADHGEEFREHGFRGHGNGLWENLLRVPLIVRPPGGREGPHAGSLSRWVETALPVHALPDLIGGSQWADWQSLGLANAGWTGLPAETLSHWIPTPDSPDIDLRYASFLLDGTAATMVASGSEKLIWQDFPEARWYQVDSAADPLEQRATVEPDPELLAEMQAWFAVTRRGLELSFDGPDSSVFHLRPDGAFRGASLYPGEFAGRTHLQRHKETTTVVWHCPPGGRIMLDRDVGQAWLIEVGEDDWVELDEASAGDLKGLHMREYGTARTAEALPPPMSPQLREQLKALGYIE